MEAIAKTRHLKGSPRKARLVIDLIRGRNVSQALNILKFTDKRAAEPITKTLRSAIANATYLAEQQNIAIDPDDLFVKTCFVDMGVHKNRRRMRPAPQGRAFREQRHYCHITILVSSDVPAKDETRSSKKSLQTAGEKGEDGAKTKASPKPKAAKTTDEPKKTTPVVADDAALKTEETVETKTPIVETPQVEETPTVTETATVEEPLVETAKPEEPIEERTSTVEAAKDETAQVIEPTNEKVEASEPTENPEAKPEKSNADDILEVDSPKAAAKDKEEKQKAEASDAKNVQSQTPAERNETKKADNAQLDENDILELH